MPERSKLYKNDRRGSPPAPFVDLEASDGPPSFVQYGGRMSKMREYVLKQGGYLIRSGNQAVRLDFVCEDEEAMKYGRFAEMHFQMDYEQLELLTKYLIDLLSHHEDVTWIP